MVRSVPDPLLPADEHSDEDSLVNGEVRVVRFDESDAAIKKLLAPKPGSVILGRGGKPRGLGAERVFCAASVSEAVVEDRG